MAVNPRSRETRQRLEKCWNIDTDWNLIPSELKEGCFQIGKALCIPPTAVLCGLITVTSYVISPAVVKVPNTEWSETALLWLSVNMPTGSTKSALYQYLSSVILRVRKECGYRPIDAVWLLGDATCEKMGDLMAANDGRLLGLYDELTSFLTQLNLYRGKGLTLSHELALFLQLYNGHAWSRTTVTGDANFSMETTSLTIGGFSQPGVARTLIEQPGSIETGLTQRFLWSFPKPSYARFGTLEAVDEHFTELLVQHLSKQWKSNKTNNLEPLVLTINPQSEVFISKFDQIQDELETLASMDELLSGMLSKSKGQILRVAAALHILFAMYPPAGSDEDGIGNEITNKAILAAINFVEVCCQQTAYMAGRGELQQDIQLIKASVSDGADEVTVDSSSATAHSLRLPGRKLYLTPLLKAKKYRNFGNKQGALAAWEELERSGLGTVERTEASKGIGTQYTFIKTLVPEEPEEMTSFAKKLMLYGISLPEYSAAIKKSEILPESPKGMKRRAETSLSTPRKSPRKSPQKSPHKTPCKSPRK